MNAREAYRKVLAAANSVAVSSSAEDCELWEDLFDEYEPIFVVLGERDRLAGNTDGHAELRAVQPQLLELEKENATSSMFCSPINLDDWLELFMDPTQINDLLADYVNVGGEQ